MQIIKTFFLAEQVTTRSNIYVKFSQSQGIANQKKMSNYVKLGRIPSESIRGWIRNAMEHLLLENGVSICHPLPENTITAERNKPLYKEDLNLGYHPRGDCAKMSGCIIYHMFGDLDKPGNLMTPAVFFYPTSGDGTITKDHNKIFNSIGGGRLEISNNSPRVRNNSHQPYMTTETVIGTAIKAPFNLILRQDDEFQKILVLKTLEYLYEKNTNFDFPFMLGGKRILGYGRAVAVFVNEKENFLTQNRNCIGIKKEEAELINEKFEKYIELERQKFPINKEDKKNGK